MNCGHDLPENPMYIRLLRKMTLNDRLEQVAATTMLKDEADKTLEDHYVMRLADVSM
jgi:hypothetical protein